MKQFILLLIALTTFTSNTIQARTVLNSTTALLDRNIEHPTSNSYSLHDILDTLPETYNDPLIEALSSIAPQENIFRIPFEPLLGLSNSKVFSFEVKNQKFVLRLLEERHPLERRIAEVSAHKIGDSLGIAPKLFFVDDTPLVMVIEFIEGREFSRHDLNDDSITSSVMQAIKKFHQYSGKTKLQKQTKIDAIQNLYERYKKKSIVFPSCYDTLYHKLLDDFTHLVSEPVPSHGDTNPRNILIANDGKIYLIDWDLSNYESPFLNIGWLSCFTAADDSQIKNLLRGYLEREPYESELQESMFLRDATTFLIATLWMGRQDERDQSTLDNILYSPIKTSSEYIKEGFSAHDISNLSGEDLTVYVLGWLKEFILNSEP